MASQQPKTGFGPEMPTLHAYYFPGKHVLCIISNKLSIKTGYYDIKQAIIANPGVTKFVESLQQIVHRLKLPKTGNSQKENPNK